MLKFRDFRFLALMLIVGCTSSNTIEELEGKALRHEISSDEERLKDLKDQILAIINDKSCTSNSGTCKAIGFGAKPCGGPSGYLIYNSGNVDELLLIEKVDEFNQLNVEYNIKIGAFSDCAMVNKPKVDCEAGQCAAVN